MKNKRTEELAVCGINAVKALEKNSAQRITRFYYNAERAPLFGSLCKILAAKRIPYNCVQDDELGKLCGSLHHQGVTAMIPLPRARQVTTDDVALWAQNKEKILVLDGVGNANNFGAIVRSAAFFGLRRIVVEAGYPYLTTSAYRIAEGGMEYVEIYAAESITGLLKSAKGLLTRVGTDVRGAVPVSGLGEKIKNTGAFIILGNEERGISYATRENCDIIAAVAAGKKTASIESLNVAQTASILLYECVRESV
jgi:TrmH RNA methyltransferase